MSAHYSMLHPHFTPDINLGHLVQAVVVIARSTQEAIVVNVENL